MGRTETQRDAGLRRAAADISWIRQIKVLHRKLRKKQWDWKKKIRSRKRLKD